MTRWLHRRLFYPVAAFVWPTRCFCCGEDLGPLQRMGACADCWSGLRLLGLATCRGCGLPGSDETDLLGPARNRCAGCLDRRSAADGVRAAVAYEGPARSLLLRAKLGRRPELFEPLSSQLLRMLTLSGHGRDCNAVVPVPSHPWINLARGFEPARALARPLARSLGVPLLSGVLRRSLRSSLSVKRLGAEARREAGLGGIHVRRSFRGERLLLIDDVMTTGITVERCARSLKTAGASRVRVAVWARALSPSGV